MTLKMWRLRFSDVTYQGAAMQWLRICGLTIESYRTGAFQTEKQSLDLPAEFNSASTQIVKKEDGDTNDGAQV
jgi:hypothetical protein